MARAVPIFRIFDYQKVVEFYVGWLGFKLDWEDKPANAPVYLQVSLNGITIHLSEHYGDCSAGARIHIEDFAGLKEYHAELINKNYKFMRPGLGTAGYDKSTLCMEVVDPFGNRITFTEKTK